MRSDRLAKLASPLWYGAGVYQRRWRRCAAQSPRAVVLIYHRIAPSRGQTRERLFGIENGTPADVFEAHMRFARRHFSPIAAADLPPTRPGFHFAVTFDDGYRDVLDLAAPILERYGIPATVFVNSDFLGTDRRFWWEQLGALLRASSAEALDVAEVAPEVRERWELPGRLSLGDPACRERAHRLLSMALMRTAPGEIDGVLSRLSHALRAPLQREGRDFPLLDWDQALALRGRGVELGAHGASHANLRLLAQGELEREIGRSVEEISAHIDAPVRTFAYPYGGPEHRSAEAAAAISRSGCRAAFTTDIGTVGAASDRWNLPRRGLGRPEAFLCAQRVDATL